MDRANLPTNANASSCRCGNALPHTHTREYFTERFPPSPGRGIRQANAQMTGMREGQANGRMRGRGRPGS